MIVKRDRWHGRTGNQIIQVVNALHVALHCNGTELITPHCSFLDLNIINRYITSEEDPVNKVFLDRFFYRRDTISNLRKRGLIADNDNIFDSSLHRVVDILRAAFVLPDIPVVDPQNLIVHVRGGDIFNRNPRHARRYTPPPLSYYTDIIDSTYHDKVSIISQDRKNPVVNAILDKYPCSEHKFRSLEEDIRYILGASTVVNSIGTLIPTLLAVSENIQSYYSYSYHTALFDDYLQLDFDRYRNDTRDYITNLDGYLAKMGGPCAWRNSKAQNDLIMNY